MAVNHWRLAVETHNTNFPQTSHDCNDISAVNPRRYPATDILIASPECTNHSLAKGKARKNQAQLNMFDTNLPDPAEERSRATMWDVPRFAEMHHYRAIVVENVVDARHWVMWDAWLHAMTSLGYEHEIVYLNSQFCWPTPQSRDRMYVVFWQKGLPKPDLDYRPPAYCPKCERVVNGLQSWKNPHRKWGRYGSRNQYVYRCPVCASETNPYYFPASTAINWSLAGERIGDRKKPLKPRTLERIRYGLKKFGQQSQMVQVDYTHSNSPRAWPLSRPMPTQTARQVLGLMQPFMLEYYSRPNAAGGIDEPLSTIVTENRHAVVVPPFLTSVNHSSDRARSIDKALPTQMVHTVPSLVTPPFFIKYYDASWNYTQGVDEPLGTILATDHHGLIQSPSFLVELYNTGWARSVNEALSTLLAQGNHHGLVTFLTSYYGQDMARHINDPMGTLSTHDRHALIAAENVEPEDCYFRMLTPEEAKKGMAFPEEYVILGNNRDRVKQAGNAVTPPAMRWLMNQVMGVFQ